MHTAEPIANEVVRLISISPQKSINGSNLSSALRATFPDFSPLNYSNRNLREFLRNHVPGVAEIGRSGGDYVYGLAEQPQQVKLFPDLRLKLSTWKPPSRKLDSQVWRAFSNTSSMFELYGDTRSGILKVIGRADAPLTEPWKKIPSCSSEKQIEIANAFIKSLSDETQRVKFTQALQRPQWWFAFSNVASQLGIAKNWNAFRGRKILEEFSATLKALGIPFQSTPRQETQTPPAHRLVPAAGNIPLLKRLAISAIERMSTAELRELRLPLGYIVDELNKE